jgi:hypothetical protein
MQLPLGRGSVPAKAFSDSSEQSVAVEGVTLRIQRDSHVRLGVINAP